MLAVAALVFLIMAVHGAAQPQTLAASPCSRFTVGLCQPSEAELIDTLPIPDVPGATATCQFLCQVQEDCSTFRYNSTGEICELYHYRYVTSCMLLGGTVEPPIDECLQINNVDPSSCDGFLQEDCVYTSELLVDKDTVTDRHSCQAYLAGLGPLLGAQYFVYDSNKHNCKLYAAMEFNCSTALGPEYPDIEECNNPMTSTTSTAGPTDSPVNNTCQYPMDRPNGDWNCEARSNGGFSTCYLRCKPGYAPTKIITSCQPDNSWGPNPASFGCAPAALLVIGGTGFAGSSFELIGTEPDCVGGPYELATGRGFAVAEVLDDLILLCGGTNLTVNFYNCMQLNTNTMTWEHHSYTSTDKVQASGAKIRNTFYLIGGGSENSNIEQIDPTVDQFWKAGPRLPAGVRAVYGQCSVPWGADSFFMTGGVYKDASSFFSNAVVLYNSTSDRWTSYSSMNKKRSNHACTIVDDKLIVAGGIDGEHASDVGTSVEVLDLTQLTVDFKPVGDLIESRFSAQMSVIGGDRVVIVGGMTAEGGLENTIEEYDLAAETWSMSELNLRTPRAAHAMVAVPDIFCH